MARRAVQTIVISGDTVRAMYTEDDEIDVRSFGTITIAKKVSDVKFNPKRQLWEAIDRKTKKVVASDPSRPGCVKKEHAYYERRILAGKYPWKK